MTFSPVMPAKAGIHDFIIHQCDWWVTRLRR
jgi:hypothetical protein